MGNRLFDKFFTIKLYFVGVSLGNCSTSETGVAILDKNLNIITLDNFMIYFIKCNF